jgi:LmbE family N-acetylglucosaminyl deacetylase
MLTFSPNLPGRGTILCLGAHCDDIEIGCAGTLLELRRRYPGTRVVWRIFSGAGRREAETRAAAARLLGDDPGCEVFVHDFRNSYFPYQGAAIKDAFEALKREVTPDLIFTHFLHDRHQDHRTVAELTWNTFRNHAVLEYEVPKVEGDWACPNVYVPLSETAVELKLRTLVDEFPSQAPKAWFDEDLFRGVMRVRGVECNAPERFAEAFHGRKVCL